MSEDWNQEFTELVRRWASGPDEPPPTETDEADGSESAAPDTSRAEAATDPDGAAAARRAAIATALVRAGFIAADHATPDNPAVEVLAELLPAEADIHLCLTCQHISCNREYTFTHSTGQFPHRGFISRDQARSNSRRVLVVCTDEALCWTASRVLSPRSDGVTLYSVPFRDILGANLRHRRKGIVDVWIDDGPTLSIRVEPDVADVLQAEVDRAAQTG